MLKLGVIGYGARIRGVIGLLQKLTPDAVVVAITDVRNDEIRRDLTAAGRKPDEVRLYADADEMLAREPLDGVMIGTRCSLHTPLALKVLQRHLPLYLEKPVTTNQADWQRLYDGWRQTRSEVVVSFPLRMTPILLQTRDLIAAGTIGPVHHVQAWNNVPYGACYYLDWYRDEIETQGLFLQKATHDFDYLTYVLGLKPRRVAAMNAKLVYRGEMPARQSCDQCPIPRECPESPFNIYYLRGGSDGVKPNGRRCGFAVDTGNEDSGSALVEYETGMHVVYSQNFFARQEAGARGARFFGYKGTVEFDWYTDEVRVFFHHVPKTATYKFDTSKLGHGGGDVTLAWNFIEIMRGEARSVSPLSAGLRSTLMCLKAKESAQTHSFQDIPDVPGLEPDQSTPPARLYQHATFQTIA